MRNTDVCARAVLPAFCYSTSRGFLAIGPSVFGHAPVSIPLLGDNYYLHSSFVCVAVPSCPREALASDSQIDSTIAPQRIRVAACQSRAQATRSKCFALISPNILGSVRETLVMSAWLRHQAASLGFEPRQRDSESLVLPLHHEAKSL